MTHVWCFLQQSRNLNPSDFLTLLSERVTILNAFSRIECRYSYVLRSDVRVAQLVERRPRDPIKWLTRGSNPVRSTRTICERFFSESKLLCWLVVSVPNPRVIIRTHKHDHVRRLNILLSMLEFDGLRKHEKTQHTHYWQKDKCTPAQ